MKIVFFGTDAFGIPSAEAIRTSGHTLMGAVTTPDTHKGRHLKLEASQVGQWAQQNGVERLIYDKKEKENCLTRLRAMEADVFYVVSFGILLPEEVLSMPSKACLNVHPSLLPLYRGPSPIRRAILSGETETGVSVLRMAKELDSGDLLMQERVPIQAGEDFSSLSERLSRYSAGMTVRALELIDKGQAIYSPQDHARATYARKIAKEEGHLRWDRPAGSAVDHVRAMVEWPGSFVFLEGKRLIIKKAAIGPGFPGLPPKPGQILEASAKSGILVAALDASVRLEVVQAEGKRPVTAEAFVGGFPIKPGQCFE